MNKLLAAVAAAGLLASAQSHATLLPPGPSMPLSASTNDLGASGSVMLFDGGTSATLKVAKFNASLGTLNSVSISGLGSMKVSFGGDNDGPDAANVHGEAIGQLRFSLPLFASLWLDMTGQPYEGVLPAGTGLEMAAAEASGTADGGSVDAPTDLSSFIGSGLLDVAVSFDDFSTIGSDSIDFGGWTHDISSLATLNVTYHYTARNQNVPEPGALALAGLALAALSLSRRRKA